MPAYFALAALGLMILFIFLRILQLKSLGIRTIHVGEIDKKDFILPPFALLYLSLILSRAFQEPEFGTNLARQSFLAWLGAGFCMLAPIIFLWGMLSFGRSFRIGIDLEKPGQLISGGAFAFSRNPLYLAFMLFLGGVFLIFRAWPFFVYLIGGIGLIHRQILREEAALEQLYGEEYRAYRRKVRRYL